MREYARRFPEAAIYSFEPVRATYKKLLEASRPFRNVRAIPLALGSKREQVKIELTGLSVQNSLRNRANGNSGICGSSVANANSEPDIEIAPETVVAGFNLWEKLE